MVKRGYDPTSPLLLADCKDHNGVFLLDGHTRALAAKKAKVEPTWTVMNFDSESEALDRAIFLQRHRRSLTEDEITRCILAVDKVRKAGRPSKELTGSQANLSKGKSSQETAEKLGISKDKVEKTRAILKDDTPAEIRQSVLSGEKSINQGYKEIQEIKNLEKSTSRFNETGDSIEWAKWTWNPVTGCHHGCKYCYARDLANRPRFRKYFPKGFDYHVRGKDLMPHITPLFPQS